jgi:hypothetical protein
MGSIYFPHRRHGRPSRLAEQRERLGPAPITFTPVLDEHCTMQLRSDAAAVVSVSSFQLKEGRERSRLRWHTPKGAKLATGWRESIQMPDRRGSLPQNRRNASPAAIFLAGRRGAAKLETRAAGTLVVLDCGAVAVLPWRCDAPHLTA